MSEHYELIKKIKDIAKQDIEQMSANGYDNIDRKCFGESVDILRLDADGVFFRRNSKSLSGKRIYGDDKNS